MTRPMMWWRMKHDENMIQDVSVDMEFLKDATGWNVL